MGISVLHTVECCETERGKIEAQPLISGKEFSTPELPVFAAQTGYIPLFWLGPDFSTGSFWVLNKQK